VVLALVARDDLRFRFAVQAAELVAQAGVGLLHFAHRRTERAELLLESGAVDGDLAGVVDEAVEQIGADAHLFLRSAHAGVVVVVGDVADRRRQWLEFDPGRGHRAAWTWGFLLGRQGFATR